MTDAGTYELGDEVYRASDMSVRVAWCRALAQHVAVRMINLDTVTTTVAELQSHTKNMSSMSHENVLRYFVSFVTGHHLWIITEYAACGPCAGVLGFIAQQDESFIAALLHSVVRGIGYLHSREQLHRGIQAENIFIHSDGRATLDVTAASRNLIDSGDRKIAQTYVGTLQWMAPEVMEQVGNYGAPADIWSLGESIRVPRQCDGNMSC